MPKQKMACVSDVRVCSMPDLSQPVPMSFVVETLVVIFAVIGLGIAAVMRAKKVKEKH